MNIKNIRKQKKKIMISAFAAVTVLFYSQWEIPTFLHGGEFGNPEMIDNITYETGSMLSEPDFIKVIYYDEKEADILWVNGRYHMVVEMKKVKSDSGELKWKFYTWHFCTPANGSPTCFFPWYGGVPSF